MTITLKAQLSQDILRTVLFYYNTHCNPDQELKLLDKPSYISFVLESYSRKPPKQIRKHGDMLTNVFNIRGFDPDDELLLYQSLCYALGNKSVRYYPSLSTALENSPTVQISLTSPI
jgi:hypothetical protein